MSDTATGLVCLIAWLAVGGWAFRRLGHETPRKALGVLFVACIILAPFAAGAAIAEKPEDDPK